MYKVQWVKDLDSEWESDSTCVHEDLEFASAAAYILSWRYKDTFVRVFDERLECVVEAYRNGKLISAGPVPVRSKMREQLTPEFAREMVAIFEKYGDILRRLANQ